MEIPTFDKDIIDTESLIAETPGLEESLKHAPRLADDFARTAPSEEEIKANIGDPIEHMFGQKSEQ